MSFHSAPRSSGMSSGVSISPVADVALAGDCRDSNSPTNRDAMDLSIREESLRNEIEEIQIWRGSAGGVCWGSDADVCSAYNTKAVSPSAPSAGRCSVDTKRMSRPASADTYLPDFEQDE